MTSLDNDFWRGKRVFLTGHTGFKGSWLSLWLQSMGVDLFGFALAPPTSPSLFEAANVGSGMVSTIGDVRDYEAVYKALNRCRPEIIIHMAAQPLVRYSYEEPIETYATNVMGTVHLLESARRIGTTKAILNVTTDKCYENREWVWGYREIDELGGYDPYSSSKACSELVTSAYRRSFFQERNISVASARAGNVIGGGDWAVDRLIPDILRSFEHNKPVAVRSPDAIRPWQHVLEPLSGYLLLAQNLYEDGRHFDEAWNFGPTFDDAQSVRSIVDRLVRLWGNEASWQMDVTRNSHETTHLKLDISKTQSRLGWHPRWDLDVALQKIIKWHRTWLDDGDVRLMCLDQINEFRNFK
jgi:CDP-glucose 4,6-dehydratase